MSAKRTGGHPGPGERLTREREVRLNNGDRPMNRQEAKEAYRERADRLKKLLYTIQSSDPEDLDMILGGAIREARRSSAPNVHIEFRVAVHGGRPWATNMELYELDHGEYPPVDRDYRPAAIVLPSGDRDSPTEIRRRIIGQLNNNRAIHKARLKKIENIEERPPEAVA